MMRGDKLLKIVLSIVVLFIGSAAFVIYAYRVPTHIAYSIVAGGEENRYLEMFVIRGYYPESKLYPVAPKYKALTTDLNVQSAYMSEELWELVERSSSENNQEIDGYHIGVDVAYVGGMTVVTYDGVIHKMDGTKEDFHREINLNYHLEPKSEDFQRSIWDEEIIEVELPGTIEG